MTLKDVPVCRFVGRKAEEADTLSNLPLYEAPFERETIQFYSVKRVPFDSDKGIRAEPRAPEGGHGPHARSREAAARLRKAGRPGCGAFGWIAIAMLAGLRTRRRPSPRRGPPADPATYGLYYDRREPSFYTGFAPRTPDPTRLHLHIGRGNQLRVTVVLADDVLEEYARDLWQRWRTYRALVDGGRLVLTQNHAFEEFEQELREVELDRLVREEKTLAPDALRDAEPGAPRAPEPGARLPHPHRRSTPSSRRWALGGPCRRTAGTSTPRAGSSS